jgi:hypothetical protein
MKLGIVLGIVLAWALSGQAQAQATSRMSPKDQATLISDCIKLIQAGKRCQEKDDCACAVERLSAARARLERLPDDVLSLGEPQDMLWGCYLRLGLVKEAKRWFDKAQPDVQDRWKSDMEGLQATYGSISLGSPEAVLNDPTLNVERVEIVPVGGVMECQASLVCKRASSEILQAFRNRDLVTDPIVLPIGATRLHWELSRESSLNYAAPRIVQDFDVPPDETRGVQIDPKRLKLSAKLLAILGPIVLAPYLLVK